MDKPSTFKNKAMQRIYTLYFIELLPLHMLSVVEYTIVSVILFAVIASLATACYIYLPQHINSVLQRGYYYYNGQDLLGNTEF